MFENRRIDTVKWAGKEQKKTLLFFSAAHFLVDFGCIYLLMAILPHRDWVYYALIYNFCAFGLQLPLGIFADSRKQHFLFAALGTALIAAAFPLAGISPYLACIASGLGNALFHIGGGVTVMKGFPHRIAPLGIFVSPGAIGVFLAVFLGKQGSGLELPVIMIMIGLTLGFYLCRHWESTAPEPSLSDSLRKIKGLALGGVFLLFLTVFFRSFVGTALSFSWQTGFWLPFIAVCAVAAGKAAGGFCGEKIGLLPTAVISLGLAAILFLFGEATPIGGISAVFFFQMTMPLTLFALGEVFGAAKGMVFGITTFALFLGTLPSLFYPDTLLHTPLMLSLSALISILLIAGGLILTKGGEKR